MHKVLPIRDRRSPASSSAITEIDDLKMDRDISGSVTCSSLAVESVIRLSTAGFIWGSCVGPFDAKKLGMSGRARTLFIGKTLGQCGFSCALFAAIFSFTQCGLQRYRRRNDWVNTLAAGSVAGAAFGVGTGNWKQVAVITGLCCTMFQYAKDKDLSG